MPELPEVTTTVKYLDKLVSGQKILSVWTNYRSDFYKGKENIKNPSYFKKFKSEVEGKKIENVKRIGKNILINIEGPKTILVHMKMTGHFLYGDYKLVGKEWRVLEDGPLQDKFNQYIRFVMRMSGGKKLVLSDVRKFAKITLIPDGNAKNFSDLKNLGPDPLPKNFDFKKFKGQILKKPNGRIKNVLMDQELIAGIGNIYSDEALWLTGIHPETMPKNISDTQMKALLKNIKKVLNLGIDFGGDSTSDYRKPDGTPGDFQNRHNVYRRKGDKCSKKDCNGTIIRKVVGGRSTHFCDRHQC